MEASAGLASRARLLARASGRRANSARADSPPGQEAIDRIERADQALFEHLDGALGSRARVLHGAAVVLPNHPSRKPYDAEADRGDDGPDRPVETHAAARERRHKLSNGSVPCA